MPPARCVPGVGRCPVRRRWTGQLCVDLSLLTPARGKSCARAAVGRARAVEMLQDQPGRKDRYNVARTKEVADSEIIFTVQESPEGGYEARALGHSIHTQAETLEELKAMLQDAVRCHFAPDDRPQLIRLHMVKDEVIPV